MQRLRKSKQGLRYFLPTAFLVISLFVAGVMLAKDSETPVATAEAIPQQVAPANTANVPKLGEKFKFGSYIIEENTPDAIEQTAMGDQPRRVGQS